MTDPARDSRRSWALTAAGATADALAVPPDRIVSPVSALVAAILVLLGLRIWRWSGLAGQVKAAARDRVGTAVRSAAWLGMGLILGLLLLAVIRWVIAPVFPAAGARIAATGAQPVWRRDGVIYVAAVGEEIVFRLLLLSAVVGSVKRLLRRAARVPGRCVAGPPTPGLRSPSDWLICLPGAPSDTSVPVSRSWW